MTETETETDRQTDRQTESERAREREREREREKERERDLLTAILVPCVLFCIVFPLLSLSVCLSLPSYLSLLNSPLFKQFYYSYRYLCLCFFYSSLHPFFSVVFTRLLHVFSVLPYNLRPFFFSSSLSFHLSVFLSPSILPLHV